ncbi:hypothetical protein M8J77_019659 [Diaphorina citri]|nr:hypothetical protein M8J77_019659 [Diaphorina citri]
MGSPMSPLLAEIYVNNFEQKLFHMDLDIMKLVFKYVRYVDDIFIIFEGNKEQLEILLVIINSIDPKMQFKMEWGGNTLNFLDLTINITQNHSLEFNVYRKATYADTIIPASSLTCNAHKRAFFVFAFDRVLNLKLPKKQYEAEVNVIFNIGLRNGYTLSYMNKILRNRSNVLDNKLLYTAPPKTTKPRYVRIPFIGQPSYNIAHKLEKSGLKAAFYPLTRLGQTLYNHKNINKMEYSGVYELKCECGAQYIGQTGRSFGARIKEHLAIPKRYAKACRSATEENTPEIKAKYKDKSAMADHLIDSGHNPELCQSKIKHICTIGKRLDILESIEINKIINKPNCLNVKNENTMKIAQIW